jgi:putative chitobiose transport system permease protein
MVVAGIAWKWLYAENGLLNQLLKTFGFTDGIPWLTTSAKLFGIVPISLASVMAVTIWKGLGYYMVIYLAGLQSIPADVYEAAAIDGSDGIRKHWDVTIPLMKPYLALVAVISAISATKVFEEVYIMTQGGPLNSSKTIVYYLYERAFSDLEISYACTIGLVLFLIILGLSVLRLVISQPGGDNLV